MPTFWPFNKRRRSTNLAVKDAASQPFSEKEQFRPARASTVPTPPVPRRSSKRGSQRKRPASPQEKASGANHMETTNKRQASRGKDTIPRRRGSIEEDITALPVSRQLQSSPHLRPIDMDKPPIPYNFRQHSQSQTSIQRQEVMSTTSRPPTLRSRKSGYDSATPQRRRSSKKPRGDALREEEIRAMSASMPVSKRAGDGPLRRDSKKHRSGMKGSNVSLPMEDSVHSSMSGIQEHRGWEVGFLDVFNPRPAVRLSGAPQYPAQGSHPNTSFLKRLSGAEQKTPEKERDKRPVTRESNKKRQTIGDRADDFDASDLRMLLERDAKRREKRKKEQQEKLDRKLKSRGGRNRGDSDRRRQEEVFKAEEAKQAAEEASRGRDLMTPPDDVHPAFREQPVSGGAERDAEKVGLGIGSSALAAGLLAADEKHKEPVSPPEEPQTQNRGGTYLDYQPKPDDNRNPFADPVLPPVVPDREVASPGPFETPLGSPMEEPTISTAQAVRMSHPGTPPLSPIQSTQSARATSGLAHGLRTSDLPEPPTLPSERRTSEPHSARERRAGAWASLFRRGGTNLRKPDEDPRASSPSDFSFSNTSRESMRNQPLPAHLVDTRLSQRSSKSGTPVRTQSKFREDLPEMPISPPDSRMPSPDVSIAAAQAATARRAMRSPKPMDIPGAKPRENPNTEGSDTHTHGGNRFDTPISPSAAAPLMSASLASVDSEGSWLANSAKRQSAQSMLSRGGVGSLSRRKPEFNASYEELGGDKDAEYLQQRSMSSNPALARTSAAHAGAAASPSSLDETESVYSADIPANTTTTTNDPVIPLGSANEPLTVHGSVRRQPTLVRRDPRVKSREGLLASYSAAEDQETPHSPINTSQQKQQQQRTSAEVEAAEAGDSPVDLFSGSDIDIGEDEESSSPRKVGHVRSARSIDYSRGHARGMSAGSAKLLDIPPRTSTDLRRGSSASPAVSAVPSPGLPPAGAGGVPKI